MLDFPPALAFDVETSGTLPEFSLQPWRLRQKKAWMTTAAFTVPNPATGELVDKGKVYPRPDDLRAILRVAISQGLSIVCWKAEFDIAWLLAYGLRAEVMQINWLCGMRAWKHLDISSSFATAEHTYQLKGEKGAAGVFLPESVGREDDVSYHSQDPAELRRLLAYNKDDTRDTLKVVRMIWDQLTPQRRKAWLIECRCLPLVAAANLEGMCVDKKAVAHVDKRMLIQGAAMEAELAPHGVTPKVIASPKQLAHLIFTEWGLPVIKVNPPTKANPQGSPSTDKDTLAELTVVDERAAQLVKYREALGLRSKFVGGIVRSVLYNGDNKTRPQAVPFGTYTGRFTYNSKQGKNKGERQVGFALHQMKRDKEFKAMIVAPEGHDLVEFDAAGQEFRWMAIASLDETMLMLCQPGEDPHSYMGAQIAGLDYYDLRDKVRAEDAAAKKVRQAGKVGNLSLQYRTSPKTFRIRARSDHNLSITKSESDKICRTYLRSYPGVPKYWERQIGLGRKLGYAETFAGRRVAVKGNWFGANQWGMESTMINYPIQGTGGDQKYLALDVIRDHLQEYDARFAWDLHDGLYFYVPKAKSLKFAVTIRAMLAALPYKEAWGLISPIPLPWDSTIGPSWGQLKPVE